MGPEFRASYVYVTFDGSAWQQGWHPSFRRRGCTLSSWGPDRTHSYLEHYPYYYEHPDEQPTWSWAVSPPLYIHMVYDPSNGTRRWGSVGRAMGDFTCPQQVGG